MEVVDYDGVLVTFSQFNASMCRLECAWGRVEFRGTHGTLLMDNGNWESFQRKCTPRRCRHESAASQGRHRAQQDGQNAMAARSVKGKADTTDHARNFLDAVKSEGEHMPDRNRSSLDSQHYWRRSRCSSATCNGTAPPSVSER